MSGDQPASTAGGSSEGLPAVEGQTFRVPIQNNDPSKTSFYGRDYSFGDLLETAFASIVKEPPTVRFQRFLWEGGVWTDGLYVEGNIYHNWIEDISVTPTEITVTIRDDARWSDGHEITGKDIAVKPLDRTIRQDYPPYYAPEGSDEPEQITAAIDGFEVSKRSVTYRSSPGFFDQFWDWTIATDLAAWKPNFVPTHVEPYADYAAAVFDSVRRAQKGEINPWERPKPWMAPDDPHKESLVSKHLAEKKYVEKFSDPDNVIVTGAWDLVELRGSKKFVFAPNPHHPNVDSINFETLIFEYTPSADRKRAELTGDRLDYGSAVTPQTVIEALPDSMTQLLRPGSVSTGNELGVTFSHPGMGKRDVRAALMYALDQETIANNVHETAAKPVTTPGGDCWDATDYWTREWLDENLITYDTDREKAATLLRRAGFSNRGGQWTDTDGTALSLTLATPDNAPRWEPTVASQLSEFGIKTSVKSMNQTTFENHVERGKYPIWSTTVASYATNLAVTTLWIWLFAPVTPGKHGFYPDQQYEEGNFSTTRGAYPITEDGWRVFTISAPPIGEPDGALTEYHPSSLSVAFGNNPPEEEFRRRIKVGMWLANWFLPTLPINKTMEQHFIDDTHWLWPTSSRSWEAFTSGGQRTMLGVLSTGAVRANPDEIDDTD